MTLEKEDKEKIIKESQVHEKDTGSPFVQISLLTEKIKRLALHLKKNRMDKHSRRGLLGLVDKRRRHLKYLFKTDPEKHKEVSQKIKED